MNSWTEDDEDSARLPEGIKRVGYDADTTQYTFLDRRGTMYRSEAGARYGTLKPVLDSTEISRRQRPQAFEDISGSPRDTDYAPRTFQDFLPPELITSPTTAPDDPPPSSRRRSSSAPAAKHVEFETKSSRGRFVSAVRSNALPKMQGFVHSLKRSVTSATKRNKSEGHNRSQSDSRAFSGSGSSALFKEQTYAELVDSDDGHDSSRPESKKQDTRGHI